MRRPPQFALAMLVALVAQAHGAALLGGTRARWRVDPLRGTTASLTFRNDAGLGTPANPTCTGAPGGASLVFDTGSGTPTVLPLPCDHWYAAGSRYRYVDPSRIVKVTYGGGRLAIKITRLPLPAPVTGPIALADVRFTVAGASSCGRFATFVRNDATLVVSHGPSTACPSVCGDGFRDDGEGCDDGNTAGGDGCRGDCTVEQCGDGIVDPGEACDGGACCSAACKSTCAHDVDGDGRVTVLCLGDSNTLQFWARIPSWCTAIAGLVGPEYTFVNRSVFGLLAVLTQSYLATGLDTVSPDAVVLAVGTNDVPLFAPADVALTLLELDAQARAHCYGPGRCVQSWVATIPPRYPPSATYDAETAMVNDMLADLFPFPTRLVDFASAMPPALYQADGLHVNADGQAERALRARYALTRQ